LRQAGQYQGAAVFTGLGLRLRHLAQWKRLPFTAVFGRDFLPVLGMFFIVAYLYVVTPGIAIVCRDGAQSYFPMLGAGRER